MPLATNVSSLPVVLCSIVLLSCFFINSILKFEKRRKTLYLLEDMLENLCPSLEFYENIKERLFRVFFFFTLSRLLLNFYGLKKTFFFLQFEARDVRKSFVFRWNLVILNIVGILYFLVGTDTEVFFLNLNICKHFCRPPSVPH